MHSNYQSWPLVEIVASIEYKGCFLHLSYWSVEPIANGLAGYPRIGTASFARSGQAIWLGLAVSLLTSPTSPRLADNIDVNISAV
jgi:hypothetical protein